MDSTDHKNVVSTDWVTGIVEGYRTKTVRIGNNTVILNCPILDDKERARKEAQVIEALRQFGKGRCSRG